MKALPKTVHQRVMMCVLRDFATKNDADADWGIIEGLVDELEGAVTRSLEGEYRTCHRQTRLFSVLEKMRANGIDMAIYKQIVEEICVDSSSRPDMELFLGMDVTTNLRSAPMEQYLTEYRATLLRILDTIQESLAQPFLSKVVVSFTRKFIGA